MSGHASVREVGTDRAFSIQRAWFFSPDPSSLSALPFLSLDKKNTGISASHSITLSFAFAV